MNKGHTKNNSAHFIERREDVNLKHTYLSEECCNELYESDKHEIVVKICDILGPNPSNLCLAEEILEKVRFDIARYVIHHEYSQESSIRSRLLIWLDSKSNPNKVDALSDFIKDYIK